MYRDDFEGGVDGMVRERDEFLFIQPWDISSFVNLSFCLVLSKSFFVCFFHSDKQNT